MSENSRRSVTVRFDKEVHDRLQALSQTSGENITELVRNLVERALKQDTSTELLARSKTLGDQLDRLEHNVATLLPWLHQRLGTLEQLVCAVDTNAIRRAPVEHMKLRHLWRNTRYALFELQGICCHLLQHLDGHALQLEQGVALVAPQMAQLHVLDRRPANGVGVDRTHQLLERAEAPVQRWQVGGDVVLEAVELVGERLAACQQLGARVLSQRALDQVADQLGDILAAGLAQRLQAVVHLLLEAHGDRSSAVLTHSGLPVVGGSRREGWRESR